MTRWDKVTLWYYDNIWSTWTCNPIHNLWWKFNHTFVKRHQYNRLDTGLPPGYYDPCTTILYAVMNALKHYIEHGAKEFAWGDEPVEDYSFMYTDADGKVDEDAVQRYQKRLQSNKDVKAELDSIYEWWVNRYLKVHDDHEAYWKTYKSDQEWYKMEGNTITFLDHTDDTLHDSMHNLEDTLETEADEMLARLMKHRQQLWYA